MPRSLFIPTIGDVLILARDWTFMLHEEHRNYKFAEDNFKLSFEKWPRVWYHSENPSQSFPAVLPVGTHLKVDRLYIRGTTENDRKYDSISFYCNIHLKSGSKAAQGQIRGRFWAKLLDVNTMIIE